MSDWQPIETAPKDRPIVARLKRHDDYPHEIGCYADVEWREAGWYRRVPYEQRGNGGAPTFAGIGYAWCEPTHWMPLPDPPQDAK